MGSRIQPEVAQTGAADPPVTLDPAKKSDPIAGPSPVVTGEDVLSTEKPDITSPTPSEALTETVGEPSSGIKRCGLFQPFPFHDDYERFTPEEREECAREFFDLSTLSEYEFLIGSRPIRDTGQLVETRALFTVSKFYYSNLQEPSPLTTFLTKLYLKTTKRDRVPILIDTKAHRDFAGRAYLSRGTIQVVDTYSSYEGQPAFDPADPSTFIGGSISIGTFNHELAHHIMYQLYGEEFPDYEGHRGHNRDATTHVDATTNPGAAWAEGLANAMSMLTAGTPSELEPYQLRFTNWAERSTDEKISNEHIIGKLLSDFIISQIKVSARRTESRMDGDAFKRARRIFACLARSGLQKNFQEFVADYIFLYPGDRPRLEELLKDYSMAEIVKAPNLIDRFIAKMDSIEVPIFGPSEDECRVGKWKRIKESGAVERFLTNPELSPRQRLENMRKMERAIENYAETGCQVTGPIF
ncbi:MAG: hypothetical protein HN337_06785 [Deltaproteobacteria bacterium]|jgi:hypothetical protein|nr:hypothetical protein [Deltaproteobacteria bacterium]